MTKILVQKRRKMKYSIVRSCSAQIFKTNTNISTNWYVHVVK